MEFQDQLPPVSEPTSRSPVPELVAAAATQLAVSPPVGWPHATEETALTELGMAVADQSWGDWVRSPVHTEAEGVPELVPMATQVLEAHEMPVTDAAPLGKFDSSVQVLAPLAAMAPVTTVGSEALLESPTPVASHRTAVGQVIVPTDLTGETMLSVVKVGVHRALVATVAGSPSRRRTTGVAEAIPTTADPLTSQVDDVGQTREERLVNVVEAGATTVHLSFVDGDCPTAPARRTGPRPVVPRA
jgi:hypothetical protein